MKLRKSEEPLPGRAVALILVLCVSGMRAETARYSVPEEAERGSFVANIAKDLGLTGEELLARQARLVPEGEKQYLELNQHTGDLVVREQMDREELCGQSEPCLVRFEVLLESPLQSFRAEVRLTDINDNSPVFLNKEIILKIPESAVPGTRFLLESAHDPDVGNNSLQHYSISSNEYFHVNTQRRNDGGRYAELVLDRALDREQQAEVAFSITAVDGGSPPRSGTASIRVVVLDINDNIPQFTQTLYKVSVMENSPQDTLVVIVSASDLDAGTNGEIVYSIFQNSEENLQTFTINPETGQIRLKKPLDYEEKKTYEIDVQATDGGGLSTHCKVEVQVKDVNDNAPEVVITSLTSTLSEAAPPNTVVALFNVRDRDSGDNGRTTCELSGEQPFRITLLAADAYALVTSETLDREQVEEYNVTVRARDEGSPALSAWKTLFVRLLDVNDNAPTFTQAVYTMVMSENEPAGRSLGRLSATDPDAGENARVRYALVPPPTGTLVAASFVSVDAESGTVRSLRPLDYEKVSAFEVTVRAADGGSPPLSAHAVLRVVVQDENDNAPVLLHPPPDGSTAGELVPRWAEAGYLVAKVVAVDADAGQNAWLSYELAKATEPGLFRVGLHSGEVRTARAVTERDAARQRLIVLVRDRGQPSRSATANLAVALVDNFSDAFHQLGQDPASGQQPQVAEEELLTTYLIASLCCVSSLFLLSILVLMARTLCKCRVRAELPPPSPSCYTDGDLASDVMGVGSTGTLSPAYRYEMCLTGGSGRSLFQFLRPTLPSPHSNAEVGLDKDEEQLRGQNSEPACDREAHAASTATPPFSPQDWPSGVCVHA
ncbi:protocadherin beta-16-like [Prinia subflava]|uniref:protocadherin beta-16-like n=1 Tax=Prinia subflava TaxID=208062 RepID=UPI002FE044C3